MKILESGCVGFRKQEHFNDPLEGAVSPVQPGADAEKILKQMKEHAEPGGLSANLVHAVKFSQTMMSAMSVGMNCVTLCLTTDPVNPLMWAHYSGLDGLVLGLNVDDEFFTSAHNACPVQFGDVVYAQERPKPIKETESTKPMDAWFRQPFDEGNLDRVRAAFLYKPDRWAYEKEVRIVKRLNDETEDSIRVKSECSAGRELYLYTLPEKTISEVYCYTHPMVLHGHKVSPGVGGGERLTKFRNHIVDELGLRLFAVTASLETWDFEFEELS